MDRIILTCHRNNRRVMSELGLFCPSCGEGVSKDRWNAAFIKGTKGKGGKQDILCDECYFESFKLLKIKREINIRRCSVCKATYGKNKWVDFKENGEEGIIAKVIEENIEIHVDAIEINWDSKMKYISPKIIQINCEFNGNVRSRAITENRVVEVNILGEICDICKKKSGGYYAGEIQVRAASRKPTLKEKTRAIEIANNVVKERKKIGDRDDFLTKIIEKKEGIDIRISTIKLGQKISKIIIAEMGGEMSSSETLVTQDSDDNRVYRVTFAVHLPAIVIGDIIDIRDEKGPILVKSSGDVVRGIRLVSGETYKGSIKNKKFDRIQHRSECERTTIVAIEDKYSVQILDPETYRPVTIPRPEFIDLDLEDIGVIKIKDKIYVLPNE